jgi:putative peptide zinc metalloprotease protein
MSMPAASAALPWASARPWPLLRDELQLHAATRDRDGSPAWHLADPVRNLFFRIGWFEFEVLRRWSLADAEAIAASIAAETTLSPEVDDVLGVVRFLQHHDLLRETQPRPPRSLVRWLLHNYLFIRVPLLRPQRRLQRLLPHVSWIFGTRFLIATLCAGFIGLILAARQWDSVMANLHGALSWDGAVAFACALVFSKLWHELGHAFTATRHGVRVGHMGIALLVLWPMAYTDTGESWKLDRSRHRLAIASAGVLAELMLAAWATLLWSFAPEGNLKNALFFLATTAWVMTVTVNASPFMRFDGYFILADALDYPGLHERAGAWAKRWLRHALLGLEDPAPDGVSTGFRRFLIGFAFASWLYRLVLFTGIALIVYHAFFKALGLLLFFVEIVTFVWRPVHMELKTWWRRRHEIDRIRLRRQLAVLGLLGLLLLVPWSSRIDAAGVLEAGAEQAIFTPFPARLEKLYVTEGEPVRAGQVLFELVAPAPEDEAAKAAAMRDAYEITARGAAGLAKDGVARQMLAEQMAEQYLAQRRASTAELQRLRLVARITGTVRDLDTTLHAGSWVSSETRLATLVDEGRKWRVEALVSEADRLRVTVGSTAKVYLKGYPQRLTGQVVTIDHATVQHLPNLALAKNHGGPIALNPSSAPKELRPAGAWYRVLIEGDGGELRQPGQRDVRVQLNGKRQSLASQWIDSILLTLLQQTGLGKDG